MHHRGEPCPPSLVELTPTGPDGYRVGAGDGPRHRQGAARRILQHPLLVQASRKRQLHQEARARCVRIELSDHGFEVAEAESGEKALQLLDEFAFDIVITDLRMPGVDGASLI